MRTVEEYDKMVELHTAGKSKREISIILNVPRRTLVDWLKRKPKWFHSNFTSTSKISDEVFINAVKSNFSKSGTLKSIGLIAAGANYRMFDKRIKRLNIDISHFTGQAHLKGKTHQWNHQYSNDTLFIENCPSGTGTIRKRIKRDKLLEYVCKICSNNGIWLDDKLTLHLDHINGINNDNRLANLRWLCPNCHSQTTTYCGRNKGK
jgi:hypothetical protein